MVGPLCTSLRKGNKTESKTGCTHVSVDFKHVWNETEENKGAKYKTGNPEKQHDTSRKCVDGRKLNFTRALYNDMVRFEQLLGRIVPLRHSICSIGLLKNWKQLHVCDHSMAGNGRG